jgi:hypothetical protein
VNLVRLVREIDAAGITLTTLARVLEFDGSTLRHLKIGGRKNGKYIVAHWRLVSAILELHKRLCAK